MKNISTESTCKEREYDVAIRPRYGMFFDCVNENIKDYLILGPMSAEDVVILLEAQSMKGVELHIRVREGK